MVRCIAEANVSVRKAGTFAPDDTAGRAQPLTHRLGPSLTSSVTLFVMGKADVQEHASVCQAVLSCDSLPS